MTVPAKSVWATSGSYLPQKDARNFEPQLDCCGISSSNDDLNPKGNADDPEPKESPKGCRVTHGFAVCGGSTDTTELQTMLRSQLRLSWSMPRRVP